MRTKIPKQIHEQWVRIANFAERRMIYSQCKDIVCRYLRNMANYNGAAPYWSNGYHYNERNNAPVPASVYAKQV